MSLKKLLQTIRHRLLPTHLAETDLDERALISGSWLKFEGVEPAPGKRRWTSHRPVHLDAEHRLKSSESAKRRALEVVSVETEEPAAQGSSADHELIERPEIETKVETCVEALVSAGEAPEESEAYEPDVSAASNVTAYSPEGERLPAPPSPGEAAAGYEPSAVGESAVVRGFRAGRSSDLSQLLGFTELVRGTRRAVRKIVDDASAQTESEVVTPPEPEPKVSTHWMAAALRRAGISQADDVPLTLESDSEEAWKTAGEWCELSMDEVAEVVANHFRLRAVDLESAEIEAMEDIPDSLMRRYRALPIAQSDRYLILAVSDPSDPHLGEAFSFVARRSVALVVAPPEAISEAIWKTYGWMP